MFKFKALATVAFSLATLGAAHAQANDNTDLYTGEIPSVLMGLKNVGAGLTVVKSFDAAGGLGGWVIQDGESGQHVVVYTTEDGEVMLAGLAIDRMGNNLSAEYTEKHVPAKDHSEAFEDFTKNSDSVVLGSEDAPVEVTVAYDSNCGFCKIFHKLVQPAIEAGEMRLRVVPVAILGSDSGPKGAAILESDDLQATMNAATYGIGVTQKSNNTAALAKVQANTELMRKHGFNGTPLVLYEVGDADESTIVIANGVPTMKPMFEVLGIDGQLDILKEDPSLARFIE